MGACNSKKKNHHGAIERVETSMNIDIDKAFETAEVSGSFDIPIDSLKVAYHIFSKTPSHNYITNKERAENLVNKIQLPANDYATLATSLIFDIEHENPGELYLKSGFQTKLIAKKLLEDQESTFDSSFIAKAAGKVMLFKNSTALSKSKKEELITNEFVQVEKNLNQGFMKTYGGVINNFYSSVVNDVIRKVEDAEEDHPMHHGAQVSGYSLKYKTIEHIH